MARVLVLMLLASFVAAFVSYRLYLDYALRLRAQQHGCQSAVRYKHKDPVFGLDIFLRSGDAISKNTFLVKHTVPMTGLLQGDSHMSMGCGVNSGRCRAVNNEWSRLLRGHNIQPLVYVPVVLVSVLKH